MPTTIKLKNSVTTTSAPSSLVQGEVAINITDKKVWVGNAATTPIQLLGDGGSGSFTSIAFGAGTVSSPSITFTGDTNTGIYSPAADTIAFTEGGVESMRIDSSGNVGIGTSSPNTKLQVVTSVGSSDGIEIANASGASRRRLLMSLDGNAGFIDSYNFAGAAGVALSLNPNGGNVGIGTSSPAQRLHVASSSSTYIQVQNTGNSIIAYYGVDTAGGWMGTGSNHYAAFYTNNAERMRITSDGIIGMGLSNPSSYDGRLILEKSGSNTGDPFSTSQSTMLSFRNANATAGNSASIFNYDSVGSNSYIRFINVDQNRAGAIAFGTATAGASNFGERMRIDSSGNVGIGTSSPTQKLHVQGGAVLINNGGGAGTVYFVDTNGYINYASSTMQFAVNGSERMRINSSGTLFVGATSGINATTPGMQYDPNGALYLGRTGTGTVAAVYFINGNGVVGQINTSGSSTSYVTSSDYRLKENVAPMTGALDKVAQLKPVTYKWKVDGSVGQGFIAHELAEVCPDAVVGEKDAVNEDGSIKPQGIDTSFLVATLTAAIQEQQAMIEELKQEVSKLKGV